MSKILCSIVIPIFNNWVLTKQILKDLSSLPDDHQIIIVDNGSTDDTQPEMLQKADGTRIKYLRLSENFGFSMANNAGYALCDGEVRIFMNNDIKVKSNNRTWTYQIIQEAQKGNIVAAQAGLLNKDLGFVREGNDIDLSNPLSYLSGWCLAASYFTFLPMKPHHSRDFKTKEMTDNPASGPWDEIYFPAYFEDTDLSFRARKAGIKMKTLKIPLLHYGRMTGKQLNLSKMYTDSKQVFVNRWDKTWDKMVKYGAIEKK